MQQDGSISPVSSCQIFYRNFLWEVYGQTKPTFLIRANFGHDKGIPSKITKEKMINSSEEAQEGAECQGKEGEPRGSDPLVGDQAGQGTGMVDMPSSSNKESEEEAISPDAIMEDAQGGKWK